MKMLGLTQMFVFLLSAAQPHHGYWQEAMRSATDTEAVARLHTYVDDLRYGPLCCINDPTAVGHDKALGEYVLFFRQSPCETGDDTGGKGREPYTLGEMAHYARGGKIVTVHFNAVLQEGGFAAPADAFQFSKAGTDYFVVQYKWPVRHAFTEGRFLSGACTELLPVLRSGFGRTIGCSKRSFTALPKGERYARSTKPTAPSAESCEPPTQKKRRTKRSDFCKEH